MYSNRVRSLVAILIVCVVYALAIGTKEFFSRIHGLIDVIFMTS